MRHSSLSLLLALPAATLGAQVTFSSPPGAFHVEGNSSSAVMFGAAAAYQSRTQQSDSNFVGEARMPIIRRLTFRRDSLTTSASIARTAEVTILMSHNDYLTFSPTYASNYKDTPVTVFTRKTINLPDWTLAPVPPPAPFDLTIPYDVPWVYNLVDALLWEVVVTNTGAAGSYSQDWFSGTGSANDWAMTIQENPGCTTPNGAFHKRDGYRTDTTSLLVGWQVQRGPASSPVTVLIGAQLASLPIQGLCAPLGVTPLLSLPIGSTDATGGIALGGTPIAWNPSFAGAELTAQGAALDASQPGIQIALSNATRTVLPKVLGIPGINCKRTFSQNSSTAVTGSAVAVSALAVQYGN